MLSELVIEQWVTQFLVTCSTIRNCQQWEASQGGKAPFHCEKCGCSNATCQPLFSPSQPRQHGRGLSPPHQAEGFDPFPVRYQLCHICKRTVKVNFDALTPSRAFYIRKGKKLLVGNSSKMSSTRMKVPTKDAVTILGWSLGNTLKGLQK